MGETGSWDFEELRLEFEELIDLGIDIVDTGFELAEADALLLDDEEVAGEAAEVIPAGPLVSRPGDVWRLGRHRLLQGDARADESYLQLMLPGDRARLVLTDVPYNVPVGGHVTSNTAHREFAMATGEMSRSEFSAFLRDALGLLYLMS